jgi:outer membrane protein TolC
MKSPRSRVRHGGVLLAFVCLPVGAWAAEAGRPAAEPGRVAVETLSLGEAVERALRDGAPTQIAGLETDRAREAALETLGAYLPQLMITSQAGWSNRIGDKMVAGDGKVYGLDNLGNDPWVDVFVQQALLDLPLWRRIGRQQLGTKLAELAERQVREAVVYEVLKLYSNLARIEELERAADAHRNALDRLVLRADHLLAAGHALKSERDATHHAHEDAQLLLEGFALERDALGAELRLALGEGRGGALATRPETLPEPRPAVFEEGILVAVQRAPGVQILQLERQIGDASVGVAEAERWPRMVLRGGYANYGIKRFDEFDDAGYIFMGMEVPLFDGFQNRYKVGGAQKTAEIARLRARSFATATRGRVEALNRELVLLARRASLAERRAVSAASQAEIAALNLDTRRGSIEAALAAHARHAERVVAAVEFRYARIEVWARLQRELGRLGSALGEPPTAPVVKH